MRALAARLDVRLVAPAAADRAGDGAAALETAGVAPLILSATRTLAGESVKALRAAIDQEPYVLFARHRRPPVLDTLRHEIAGRAPSVLYLDHLDSLVYADALPSIPVVIDMHNVYSRLVARMAVGSGVIRRRYLERESILLEKMERRAVATAHTVLAVSADEAAYFRALGARRVVVVPNGVDCQAYATVPMGDRSSPPTLLFVGALDWPPNVDAVRFLISDVMPAVRTEMPEARLMIVGRDPSPDLLALAAAAPHVEVASNVKDVRPYYETAHALLVPLDAGGGTRLKILEAFAAGVPVISTPVGCEGLDVVPGTHLLVTDKTEMAAAAAKLLRRRDRARVLAICGRTLARERYDWSIVGGLAVDAVVAAAAPAGRAWPQQGVNVPAAWVHAQ